jgi:hypothetical protein
MGLRPSRHGKILGMKIQNFGRRGLLRIALGGLLLVGAVAVASAVYVDAQIQADVDDYYAEVERYRVNPVDIASYEIVYANSAEYRWQETGLIAGGLVGVFLVLSVTPVRAIRRFAPASVVGGCVVLAVIQFDRSGAAYAAGWALVAGLLLAAIVLFGRIDLRALIETLRETPGVLPITVLVLLAPLLTSDVWQIAGHAGAWRIAGFGVVVVIPLLAVNLLEVRRAAAVMSASARTEDGYTARPRLLDRFGREISADEQRARSLGVIASRKLISLVWASFLAVAGYIFVITSIVVDPAVASAWSGERALPTARLFASQYEDGGLVLHGGPYVDVAVFFGVLAVCVLLASNVAGSKTPTRPDRLVERAAQQGATPS